MARPSNKQQRRTQIAHALMKVMAEQGYDGASIAEVAEAANLTPGLIHYHFKNKQEILLVLVDEMVQDHEEGLAKRLVECGENPTAELHAFIDFHVGLGAYSDPKALACWLVLSTEALRQPTVRKAFESVVEQYLSRLGDIIERGVEKGQFQTASPSAAASALMATIQGYFVLAATARDQIPRGSASQSIQQMANGLLCPQPR